jgi:hypothetical protein
LKEALVFNHQPDVPTRDSLFQPRIAGSEFGRQAGLGASALLSSELHNAFTSIYAETKPLLIADPAAEPPLESNAE